MSTANSGSQPARRGAIHFHSRFSPDSVTSIGRLVRVVRELRLDFAILTDHDTLEGARALRSALAVAGVAAEVPLAAEYRTERGDIIVAFVEREITSRVFSELVGQVRAQGGLLLLPHPYHYHSDPEGLAAECDLVEVFNGRLEPALNAAASALAERLAKPVFSGSDAHLARNLADVVVEVPPDGSLEEALKQLGAKPVGVPRSSRLDLPVSQFIKAVRNRDLGHVAWLAARIPWRAAKRIARFLAGPEMQR
jgi:predicted metal-dependent phosphoesterase TrpH